MYAILNEHADLVAFICEDEEVDIHQAVRVKDKKKVRCFVSFDSV